MNRELLIKRIVEVALLHGEFTLRSGRKSKYYLDKYRFETHPDVLHALGEMFREQLGQNLQNVARFAGAELGAVSLAAAASMACGKPFVIVRNKKKDYGTAKQIEGVINAGDIVVLVEDVVTSGGQVIEAVKSLREAGASVFQIICVIDRQEGGAQKIYAETGIHLDHLFTSTDLGIVPDQQPPAATSPAAPTQA